MVYVKQKCCSPEVNEEESVLTDHSAMKLTEIIKQANILCSWYLKLLKNKLLIVKTCCFDAAVL